ncbi:MAG: DUF4349 domain-containing protein [Betaproteobacteria bacterium]
MSAAFGRSTAALLCAAALLAGCSRPADMVGVAERKVEGAAADKSARRASLAITRRAELQLETPRIAPLFNATVAACNAAATDSCVVLESSLSTGTRTHAELKLRAVPAGIARILATLRTGNGLVSESASAEDLAAPIADVERQLAMAREYRDSLLALRARGGNDIAALMKINQELAQVQSQLESATGERAHMQQRVDTETLTIEMNATGANDHEFLQPISRSLHDFGDHLAGAAANAITFIAYLIPWAVVLVPLGWLVRRVARRWHAPRKP